MDRISERSFAERVRHYEIIVHDEEKLWESSSEYLQGLYRQIEAMLRGIRFGEEGLANRLKACLEQLVKTSDDKERYLKYVRSNVDQVGKLGKYNILRKLQGTCLDGEVYLAENKDTKKWVAIKQTSLWRMRTSTHEYPLHEAYIYRLLRYQEKYHRIPPPPWYARLGPAHREDIALNIISLWTGSSGEQRRETLEKGKKLYMKNYKISELEAERLFCYFILLLEAQPFFRLFGSRRQSREGYLHPHIGRFVEDFCDEKFHYLVLEFCSGGDFYSYINTKRRGYTKSEIQQHERIVAKYFAQLLWATTYLHKLGLSHLDISLEQLLLNEHNDTNVSDQVPGLKLIDFGQTRFGPKFPAGMRCGKESYRSPEILHRKPIDGELCDVFCMGVTLSLMSLGYPLFRLSVESNYRNYVTKGKIAELLTKFSKKYSVFKPIAKIYENSGLFDLLTGMLQLAQNRYTIKDILSHRWFTENVPIDIQKAIRRLIRDDSCKPLFLRRTGEQKASAKKEKEISKVDEKSVNSRVDKTTVQSKKLSKREVQYGRGKAMDFEPTSSKNHDGKDEKVDVAARQMSVEEEDMKEVKEIIPTASSDSLLSTDGILIWDEKSMKWEVQPPGCLKNCIPPDRRGLVVKDIGDTWRIRNRAERESKLRGWRTCLIERFKMTPAEAEDLLWYVFLLLTFQHLQRVLSEEKKI
mmetsp:Transcript_17309/g.25956  ORF Transcript_17309/g.25956 Transcript_17309/m.25956 type:complete len:694 (-) Transcript_17309:190-2271(-)